MKAEHLRLNNLVKVNWEDEHRWCALDFWEGIEFEPIPLTEEWLERFGFEEDDSVGWLKRFDKSDSFFIDLSFMYWGENSVKLTHVRFFFHRLVIYVLGRKQRQVDTRSPTSKPILCTYRRGANHKKRRRMKIEGLIFLIFFICPLIAFVTFYWMYLIYSVSRLIVDIIWDMKVKSKTDETDETKKKVNQ